MSGRVNRNKSQQFKKKQKKKLSFAFSNNLPSLEITALQAFGLHRSHLGTFQPTPYKGAATSWTGFMYFSFGYSVKLLP